MIDRNIDEIKSCNVILEIEKGGTVFTKKVGNVNPNATQKELESFARDINKLHDAGRQIISIRREGGYT